MGAIFPDVGVELVQVLLGLSLPAHLLPVAFQ